MSILLSDLKFYASDVVAEDEVTEDIGGDRDFTKKFDFSDFSGTWQIVSSNGADTAEVQLFYRDLSGALLDETLQLDGLTPVPSATPIDRVLKAVKSESTLGDVALEKETAERTNTLPAQSGLLADQIKLDAGASAVNGFYNGMVFRATGGTGANKIVEIIAYDGATKVATVSRSVSGDFDATTTFRVSKGVFFDKTPNEIMYVVRLGYNSSANPSGGADVDFYVKGFFEHTDASGSGLTLTAAQVRELADPSGDVTFGLDAAINGTTSNGAGNNRQDAPGGITFDNADKAVPGDELAPDDKIGVWIKLHRAAGAPALNTTWTPQLRGQTT